MRRRGLTLFLLDRWSWPSARSRSRSRCWGWRCSLADSTYGAGQQSFWAASLSLALRPLLTVWLADQPRQPPQRTPRSQRRPSHRCLRGIIARWMTLTRALRWRIERRRTSLFPFAEVWRWAASSRAGRLRARSVHMAEATGGRLGTRHARPGALKVVKVVKVVGTGIKRTRRTGCCEFNEFWAAHERGAGPGAIDDLKEPARASRKVRQSRRNPSLEAFRGRPSGANSVTVTVIHIPP